jgi:hypothetical protein
MIQDFLTYLTLGIAVAFLVKKFFYKKKKTNKNCGDDCNCH